jgi:CO/xanthine dehydrogenase Mo-binding subunit
MWQTDVDRVIYDKGTLREDGGEGRTLSFNEVAAQSGSTGGPIVGNGAVTARGVGAAFGVHIVDVEVDPDTGKTEVLRYTAVQDAGRAIHPAYVEGQMQGGVAQGVGWALNEEYYYDDEGRLVNASLLDYRMPTSLDLPEIETVIVEVPNPNHPYGVRGVGEVPIVPPLAAVANAIYNATGHRFRDLPMSPRRVVERLHNLNGE